MRASRVLRTELYQRPFPFAEVRDLIAICRCLFRVYRGDAGAARQLSEITAIGRELRDCVALAKQGGPGSLGCRAAIERADAACSRLGYVMDEFQLLRPLLAPLEVKIRTGK